jgi:hypothetical protein
VLKIIQGSAWGENNVTIVTSHLDWEFVQSFVQLEGYEFPDDDAIPLRPCMQFDVLCKKKSLTVTISVYNFDQDGTLLSVVMNAPFTASMCYLTVAGIVMLYPQLTFSSKTSVQPKVFHDAQDAIEKSFANVMVKGLKPFRIGNLTVTTLQLAWMKCKARCSPQGEMIWRINWKPCPAVVAR